MWTIWSHIFHSRTFESMEMADFSQVCSKLFLMTPTNYWGIWTEPWRFFLLSFVPALAELFRPWNHWNHCNHRNLREKTGWWFQPIWKIWVKIWNLPQIGMKMKNIYKYLSCHQTKKKVPQGSCVGVRHLPKALGPLVETDVAKVQVSPNRKSPPGIATSTSFAHPRVGHNQVIPTRGHVDFPELPMIFVAVSKSKSTWQRTEIPNLCHSSE